MKRDNQITNSSNAHFLWARTTQIHETINNNNNFGIARMAPYAMSDKNCVFLVAWSQ